MAKSELVDVEMVVIAAPQKSQAIFASATGDKEDAVWLPYSEIEIEKVPNKDLSIITMPRWLAEQKGLV